MLAHRVCATIILLPWMWLAVEVLVAWEAGSTIPVVPARHGCPEWPRDCAGASAQYRCRAAKMGETAACLSVARDMGPGGAWECLADGAAPSCRCEKQLTMLPRERACVTRRWWLGQRVVCQSLILVWVVGTARALLGMWVG